MPLAATLAEFAASRLRASETVERMIRLSLLDWAGCALAGVGEPVSCALREVARTEGGRAEAGVIGGARVPARAAALVNGATSHALDYDDTHFAHIGHPSVAVFPAVLAVAEREGIGMTPLIEAALVGVEASVRIGLWLGRDHYQVGFHQTATAGAFGATLAVARLQGLSEAETGHALGLAATRAAGIKAQFGTMGKPLNAGLAAECGVMAVDWVRAGVRSNPDALDGDGGFGPIHHGAGDLSAFDGLGSVWLFEDISHKFHACCHGLHAMLEALRGLNDVPDKLVIRTHPRWTTVCNIEAPETGLEAKFSYRAVAAMTLAGVDTGAIETFSDEMAKRPDIRALMERVTVEADETLTEMQTRLWADGAERFHDLASPLTIEDRAARIFAKTQTLAGRAADLQAAIDAMDLAAFTRSLFRT